MPKIFRDIAGLQTGWFGMCSVQDENYLHGKNYLKIAELLSASLLYCKPSTFYISHLYLTIFE